MPLPDLLTDMPGHRNAVLDSYTIYWNEGHYVGCPHPRMCALMLGQIEQFSRLTHSPNRGFLDRFPLAHEGNHATVVVRVHLAVQQVNAIDLHGIYDCVNFAFVTSFRKIGNAFD